MAIYYCFQIEVLRYFALIGLLAGAIAVYGQPGFVSIDCGTSEATSYVDKGTGIEYTPDSKYISTGINYGISQAYIDNSYPKYIEDLRSFPTGSRNCYTIKEIHQGGKYLIRGYFLYGNYDGRQSASSSTPLLFNLYIGVNFWSSVNITDASELSFYEIITIATADYFSICLENTKSGTPFISALELRKIDDSNVYTYVNQSISLDLVDRQNFGASTADIIRYPDDIYDRIWTPFDFQDWTPINATDVKNGPKDTFHVPSMVMSTACTPTDTTNMTFYWSPDSGDHRPVYYIYLHFAELESLQKPMSRSFDVLVNDELRISKFKPDYLLTSHITLIADFDKVTRYTLDIQQAAGSTLPPILNAVEIYRVVRGLDSPCQPGNRCSGSQKTPAATVIATAIAAAIIMLIC